MLNRFRILFSNNVHIPHGDPQITDDLLDYADTHWQKGVWLVNLNQLGHHWRKK